MADWISVGELDLVGRRNELSAIDAAWAADSALVTLLGPGGVGKTRLASVWAAQQTPVAPVVALAAQRDLLGLVHAVAAELEHALSSALDLMAAARQVGRRLAGTSIVLDNLEQLDELGQVLGLWAELGVRILATSRTPVGLESERVILVSPLALDDAVALFEKRAGHLADVRAQQDEIRELVRSVGAIPFAVELASRRVGLQSPSQIRSRVGALAGTASNDRHRSVQACLTWSWELLSPDGQAALAALGLFQTPFTLEDAEAVVPDAWDVVERLWSASMLVRYPGDPVRFAPYELVHRFVDGRADAQAQRRWIDWVLSQTAANTERASELEALRPEVWSALTHELASAEDRCRLRLHTRTLHAADTPQWLKLFAGHETDVLGVDRTLDASVTEAYARILEVAGQIDKSGQLVDQAMVRQGDARDGNWAWLLTARAAHGRRTGRFESARDDLVEATTMLEGKRLAMALERLGDLLRMQHALGESETAQRRALQLYVDAGDVTGQSSCWCHLAHIAGRRGEREAAHAAYRTAEAFAPTITDRAAVMVNRLNFEASSGDPSAALALVPATLDTCEQTGSLLLRAMVLACAAIASIPAGESPQKSLERGAEALPALLAAGESRGAITVMLLSTGARMLLDDLDGAESLLDEVGRVVERSDLPQPRALLPWRALLALLRQDAVAASSIDLGDDSALVQAARLAIATDAAGMKQWIGTHDGVGNFAIDRLTARLLEKLMGASTEMALASDGSWFELRGNTVDMRRRGASRRVLVAIARSTEDVVTADVLIRDGWPGERIRPDAARMRLHTAIRTLRRLGLEDVIVTVDGGYRMASDVAVRFVES